MSIKVARGVLKLPYEITHQCFEALLTVGKVYDSQFLSTSYNEIIAIGGFDYKVPAIKELYKNPIFTEFVDGLCTKYSYLLQLDLEHSKVTTYQSNRAELKEIKLPDEVTDVILRVCKDYKTWAGFINSKGEHVIHLKNPVPGPHFYTNMLLGNRIKFPYALQSTPKSIVDRFGGGSFRSHAAVQVLATRWDFLPEENGFPANRQFYIVENGKQIFYSADVVDSNVKEAYCIHSQNHTVITYQTKCGLSIKRTIFLVPQYDGLPLATEVQRIQIKNESNKNRDLKVVLTGMLGTEATHALMEDVVYSTVIMQGKVFHNKKGDILAYSPSYYPDHARGNVRFTTAMVFEEDEKKYAKELCTQYQEFVGSGDLNRPEGVMKLTNKLCMKGPGFFALSCPIHIEKGKTVDVDHFVGLVSEFGRTLPGDDQVEKEIKALHNHFNHKDAVEVSLQEQLERHENYSSYLQVETGDKQFDTYMNTNLPFQVLYQTFVSRSFDLTQKGYRELGFREVQDIFVSMYYLVSMGEMEYTKSLLKEWICKVFEFGYCYHNFFWKGKEAGKWSDDGLWLLQAVHRYINYTGDLTFLDETFEMPESEGKVRSVYETLQAIIKYSSEISIGVHGLPLIDYADWNDCLKVDEEFLSGPEKEKIYKETGKFESKGSESVMNAFLLEVAMKHMIDFAKLKEDTVYAVKLEEDLKRLSNQIQKFAWYDNFFARVLFNRFDNEITYLGAKGDGFSSNQDIDGTYFLNSFSWSILAGEAEETQIAIMLDTIEAYLKTPFGFKLMSETDLSKVAKKTATGEYFPGDRENGAVFKHATMMATAAMIKGAKTVKDEELARRLLALAYWMVKLVLPYRTLENPFEVCGNPRWCTQYNNSITGENIGPTLSGTSTWMLLTLIEMFGIEYCENELVINPILEEEQRTLSYTVRFFDTYYKVSINKPDGFYRILDHKYQITEDGILIEDNKVPLINDGKVHEICVIF